ncbi:HAMP domain-containing histidine kinase [bacterium]|nr:HAMP domain-containing histidine kinase [bacterium]
MNMPKAARFRASLGLKASLAVIALICLISALFSTFFILYQKSSSLNELRKRALSLAETLAYNSRYSVYAGDIQTLSRLIDGSRHDSDILRAALTDLEGKPIVSSGFPARCADSLLSLGRRDSLADWFPLEEGKVYRAQVPIPGEQVRSGEDESFLFEPLSEEKGDSVEAVKGETIAGYAVLDVSLGSMNRGLTAAARWAGLLTLALILVSIAAVVLIVRRLVSPIYSLAEATQEVARGEFGLRVELERKDELGVLADSFNEMSTRLKTSRDEFDALNQELEKRVSESTSELVARYGELQSTLSQMRSLNAAKDDFISLVSHELRTPLSSIQLFSETLLHGLSKEETKRADVLSTIIRNCRRLSRLINDVLDLSRMEAGRVQVHLRRFDLAELTAVTLDSLEPNFADRSLVCAREFPRNGIELTSDPDKVIQVVTNVVGNAIKFSPAGSRIEVGIEMPEGDALIRVRDHGPGIAPEDIPKVFDKFHQLENINLTVEGSGLGMSISKTLVEVLGGRIWIESRVGDGTCVFIRLPGKVPARLSAKARPA